MGRAAYKAQSVVERMKQDYIGQLNTFGITAGPDKESLQSMNNADLCRLVSKEHSKRD